MLLLITRRTDGEKVPGDYTVSSLLRLSRPSESRPVDEGDRYHATIVAAITQIEPIDGTRDGPLFPAAAAAAARGRLDIKFTFGTFRAARVSHVRATHYITLAECKSAPFRPSAKIYTRDTEARSEISSSAREPNLYNRRSSPLLRALPRERASYLTFRTRAENIY